MKILYPLQFFILISAINLYGADNKSPIELYNPDCESPWLLKKVLFFTLKSGDCSDERAFKKSKELLEKGAPINEYNNRYRTPLHLAALYGYTSTVELFLEKKADIHKLDLEGCSPLHCAVFNGHTDIVKLLLKAGADPMQTNIRGYNAKTLAQKEGFDSIDQLFFEPKLYPTINDHDVQKARPFTPKNFCLTTSIFNAARHLRFYVPSEQTSLYRAPRREPSLEYTLSLSLSPIEKLMGNHAPQPIEQNENTGECSPTELDSVYAEQNQNSGECSPTELNSISGNTSIKSDRLPQTPRRLFEPSPLKEEVESKGPVKRFYSEIKNHDRETRKRRKKTCEMCQS